LQGEQQVKESLQVKAIRMFSTVHGYSRRRSEDAFREFCCLNSDVQRGWMNLAKQTEARIRRASIPTLYPHDEH